jgi:hypothetical protein
MVHKYIRTAAPSLLTQNPSPTPTHAHRSPFNNHQLKLAHRHANITSTINDRDHIKSHLVSTYHLSSICTLPPASSILSYCNQPSTATIPSLRTNFQDEDTLGRIPISSVIIFIEDNLNHRLYVSYWSSYSLFFVLIKNMNVYIHTYSMSHCAPNTFLFLHAFINHIYI